MVGFFNVIGIKKNIENSIPSRAVKESIEQSMKNHGMTLVEANC